MREKRSTSLSEKVKFVEEIPYQMNETVYATWNGTFSKGKLVF
jgi:hypothetical protein